MPVRSAAASDPRRSPNAPAEMSRSVTTRQTSPMSDDQSLSKPFPYDEPAPKMRKYTLTPKLHKTTKAAEKLLLKHLSLTERAGELFAEASAALTAAMKMRTGRREHQRPAVEPGLVYELSQPRAVKGKMTRTFQVVDNFTQPEVSKMCRMSRYKVTTWTGNGPGSETKAGAIAAAAADVEREELP